MPFIASATMTEKKITYGVNGYRIQELTIDEFVNHPDVPEGWRHIVRKLVLDLFDHGWDGRVSQIKEKFGALRFYANLNEVQRKDLEAAMSLSEVTCRVTGLPGKMRYDLDWIMPLCDEQYRIAKERYYE